VRVATQAARLRIGDTLALKDQLLLHCTERELQAERASEYPVERVPPFGRTWQWPTELAAPLRCLSTTHRSGVEMGGVAARMGLAASNVAADNYFS